MKISEINLDVVEQYLQLDIDRTNLKEVLEIEMYIASAKSYVAEFTGLTLEEIEEIEHLVPPTLLLISDMFENKTLEGGKNQNLIFKSFININKKVNL